MIGGKEGGAAIAQRSPVPASYPQEHSPTRPDGNLYTRPRILSGQMLQNTQLNLTTNGNWQIRSCILDNWTNQWIFIPEAFRYVPPFTFGIIMPLAGDATLTARFEAPPGVTQDGFAGASPTCVWIVASENEWQPHPGRALEIVP